MRPCHAVALACCAASISACATFRPVPPNLRTPHERYDALCQSWVGSNVSKLIASWGPPTQTTPTPDGSTVYTWSTAGNVDVGSAEIWHIAELQKHAGYWCNTRFTAGANGVISSFHWDGWDTASDIGCNARLIRDPQTGEWSVSR